MTMYFWTCPNCGRPDRDKDPILIPRGCPQCGKRDITGDTIRQVDGDEAGIIEMAIESARKVKRYARSTSDWIAKGRPVRTNAEVDKIFSEFCNPPDKPCEWFKNGTCTHKLCGCKVRSSKGENITLVGSLVNAVFANNKLRRETEHCPIGLW